MTDQQLYLGEGFTESRDERAKHNVDRVSEIQKTSGVRRKTGKVIMGFL